jgi:hypothetical protein
MMAKKTLTKMTKSLTGGGDDTNPMREELELMRTKEDYGIENIQILAYKILIQMCERLGVSAASQPLKAFKSKSPWQDGPKLMLQ